jgi:hypothetical protein
VTSAAQDEEAASRLHDVISTAQRLGAEETVTGAPTLAELMGDDIVTTVCKWLGLGTAKDERNTVSRSRGGGLVKELSDEISSTENFGQDQSGELHRFSNGVYVPDGERRVKCLVKTLLERRNETQLWSSNRAQEVVEYLRVDSPLLWDRPPLDVVNVAKRSVGRNHRRPKATFTGVSFERATARGVQRIRQVPGVGKVHC